MNKILLLFLVFLLGCKTEIYKPEFGKTSPDDFVAIMKSIGVDKVFAISDGEYSNLNEEWVKGDLLKSLTIFAIENKLVHGLSSDCDDLSLAAHFYVQNYFRTNGAKLPPCFGEFWYKPHDSPTNQYHAINFCVVDSNKVVFLEIKNRKGVIKELTKEEIKSCFFYKM